MTPEEFCKKWCHNGHDPSNCQKLQDLRAMLSAERERCREVALRYSDEVDRMMREWCSTSSHESLSCNAEIGPRLVYPHEGACFGCWQCAPEIQV